VRRFVTQLNARRVFRGLELEGQRVCLTHLLRGANLAWHGVKLSHPDWGESSHSVVFTVEIRREKMLFHSIFNAYWEALDFELPRLENPWRRWIDTARDSPHDIVPWETAESVPAYSYRAEARSVVMLFCGEFDRKNE
jgi:glycogen operon protein